MVELCCECLSVWCILLYLIIMSSPRFRDSRLNLRDMIITYSQRLISDLISLISAFYCKFCTFRIILFYIVRFFLILYRGMNKQYTQTNIFGTSFQNGLTNLFAQLVSILRANLSKVVVKCKIVCF